MENLVVASFIDPRDANGGLNKLKELDELGDIVIYNMVLIRKTAENHFEFLYNEGPDTDDMPAKGALIGTLVGAIGGPVGMLIGMLTGATAGAIDEDDTTDFSGEFLAKVNAQLAPGSYAIVLDVEEDNDFMIDSYIGGCNGVIVRTLLSNAQYVYDREQDAELDKEIAEQEAEMKIAREEDKARFNAKINELKAKRAERHTRMKAKFENTKKHFKEKMDNLHKKIADANGKRKERLKAHEQKVEGKFDKLYLESEGYTV
jgi:uncharacterized membrane protein